METKTFGDKKLTIAPLSAKDLKHAKRFMNFINSLVEEDAKILMNKKKTLKEETEFVKDAVKKTKEGNKIFLVAKDDEKVVANTGFELEGYKKNHIAKLGIAIRQEYRGIGLGNYMLGAVMKLAKEKLKPTPKIFQLEVYANNKPAIGLYKKMGFKIVGKIPKQLQYKGKLITEYIMIKEVK